MASRNPPWSRDELIVALEFYLTYRPSIPSKQSSQIRELSNLLNRLQALVGGQQSETFRNANGVYMKLMNFRRFDPGYEGVGLQRGNKDEAVVWARFAEKRDELKTVAASITSFVSSDLDRIVEIQDEEIEAEEGRLLTRVHLVRERNRAIVERKKEQTLSKHGRLSCEACGFDFEEAYGERGAGFIECHHTRALRELTPGSKTKLSDLALVTSNCHRMIHRSQPWLTIQAVKAIVEAS